MAGAYFVTFFRGFFARTGAAARDSTCCLKPLKANRWGG
jgi:hypothetical protein